MIGMDANELTEALKFAVHHKDALREITVRFSDDRSVTGYLSKVSAGEVLLTEAGAVLGAGHDHRIDPESVMSLQVGLADGSFKNF
jgi:hypothetical protein